MSVFKEQLDFIFGIAREIQGWVSNALEEDNKENPQYHAYSDHWDVAYDLVFNKEVSTKVFSTLREMNLSLDYCDPDSTPKEDVMAFSNALNEKVATLQKLTRKNKM